MASCDDRASGKANNRGQQSLAEESQKSPGGHCPDLSQIIGEMNPDEQTPKKVYLNFLQI